MPAESIYSTKDLSKQQVTCSKKKDEYVMCSNLDWEAMTKQLLQGQGETTDLNFFEYV
jgi:hypothetical protein